MLACLAPFLAGILGLWLIDQSNPYGRLACLWISFAYTATWTLSMSVATANTAGHTKKITTNAMLLIGYCVGNFIGPFFFKTEQAPRYTLGVAMMIFCVGLQIACLAGIWVLLWTRNHSRKTEHAESPENEQQAYERGLLDQTDFENKYFKVSDPQAVFLGNELTMFSMSIKLSEGGRCRLGVGTGWQFPYRHIDDKILYPHQKMISLPEPYNITAPALFACNYTGRPCSHVLI